MAPSSHLITLADQMLRRQDDTLASNAPKCVMECMNNGPTDGCAGVSDYKCTCASSNYITWVTKCWDISCNSEQAAYGQAFASQACAFYGSPLNTTIPGGEPTPSGPAVLTPPITTSQTFINIQAIMSSICSALLVAALVLGVLSCRARAKADQATSQNRTWNGVTGLTTMDSKAPKSSRFFTRTNNSSAFTNSRNATSTFQSDNFGVTSSNFGGTTLTTSPNQPTFGSSAGLVAGAAASGMDKDMWDEDKESPNPRGSGVRFTNRLTLEEISNGSGAVRDGTGKSEEWEMSDVNLNETHKSEVEVNGGSPTSMGSKMESEVEYALGSRSVDGSTVHLNVLPKEGSGYSARGKADHHAL